MPNLDDELTCIFVEVITVDPPVPALDAKTIVLQSSAAGAAGVRFCARRVRPRALLSYSEHSEPPSKSTGTDDAHSRRAMTVRDERHRSGGSLAIEQRAGGATATGVADHILWGAPLFVTGFLAAFCAAAVLFLTPVWGGQVRDLANHARHGVGQYRGR
jgi:hypothetical protein